MDLVDLDASDCIAHLNLVNSEYHWHEVQHDLAIGHLFAVTGHPGWINLTIQLGESPVRPCGELSDYGGHLWQVRFDLRKELGDPLPSDRVVLAQYLADWMIERIRSCFSRIMWPWVSWRD